MRSIENKHLLYLFHTFAASILLVSLTTASDAPPMRENTVMPEIETYSLEGLPVSFRPSQGKVLLVQIWKPEDSKSIALNKESVLLYRRFHQSGLDALSVCCDCSEDAAAKTAERWQIDWPQVMNEEEDPSLTKQIGVDVIPSRFFVDSEGKIVLLNPSDEELHASVAGLLGVSLDDVPMPDAPTETRSQSRIRTSIPESPETPSFHGGRLYVREVDRADPTLLFGSKKERETAKETIKIFRQISLALTHYRMDNNGEMPNWLSDLYPDYLANNVDLLCPSDPTLLRKFSYLADRNVPTSFTYEFAPLEMKGEANRAVQKRNLSQYGDKTPVVRCFKFERPLCLTYGGEILFLDEAWDSILPTGKTLEDPDAKVRNQLMQIGVALQQYKIKNDSVPNNLSELVPDYVKDESLFTCEVTGEEFEYAFAPDKSVDGGNLRDWSIAKREKYGEIVPIVRALGVPSQERAINLAYGGEIWESRLAWENDLTISTNPNSTTIVEVPPGSEISNQQARQWPDALLTSETPIDTPNAMMPLRGDWTFQKDKKWLRMPSDRAAPTSILFSPPINTGEIRMKARVNSGKEGVKIIFGYTSPNRYFKMNIGGFDNRFIAVRKWIDLDGSSVSTVSEQVPFVFPYNKWCNVRMSVDGESNTARCYVDDKLILTFNSTESLQGRFGLATWYTSADFESIVISPTITPTPEETITTTRRNSTSPPTNSPKRLEEIGIITKWDIETKGYRIYSVAWKSPAFSAGLLSDDLITKINQKSFPTAGNPEDMLKELENLPWTLTILRQGNNEPQDILIASSNSSEQSTPPSPSRRFNPIARAQAAANAPSPNEKSNISGVILPANNQIPSDWSLDPIKEIVSIVKPSQTRSGKITWVFQDNLFKINEDHPYDRPVLIFSPLIDRGEIRLKANRGNGQGGVRILFGVELDRANCLCWSIGGWYNQSTQIEKWGDMEKDLTLTELSEPIEFSLPDGKWVDIRLTLDSDNKTIQGYVNNKKIVDVKIEESMKGRLGVGGIDTDASFKDIEIEGN